MRKVVANLQDKEVEHLLGILSHICIGTRVLHNIFLKKPYKRPWRGCIGRIRVSKLVSRLLFKVYV